MRLKISSKLRKSKTSKEGSDFMERLQAVFLLVTTIQLARRKVSMHDHTRQPVRLKILEILFFITLSSHIWEPPPPTARILSYLSSAQQDLTGESQENIRKPVIAILTLSSGIWNTGVSQGNTGDLTGMDTIMSKISRIMCSSRFLGCLVEHTQVFTVCCHTR